MIPEMYKLRNSIKKRKFKINYSLRVILILLFLLFVLINITYSYIQLRVLSTDEPFIGIQDELKRIQENEPLEKVGIEIKEISDYSKRKEEISINLPDQKIVFGNKEIQFEIDPFKKKCLIEGLDDIALSLEKSEKISVYENKLKVTKPWIFND